MPKQRTQIPFGPFDVSVPRHDAGPGVLRAVRNLVPDGSPERPRWSAAEGAAQLGELDGILALGAQVRSRRGALSDQDTSTALPVGLYINGDSPYSPPTLPAGAWGAGLAAAEHDGLIYVQMQSDFVVFDPADGSTSSLAAPSTQVSYATLDAVDGKLYLIGGDVSGTQQDSVQIYDIEDDSWSAGTAGPVARWISQSFVYDGKVYVVGGSEPTTATARVDIYDPAADSWSTGTSAPTEMNRAFGGWDASSNKFYIGGGVNGNGNDVTDLYVYEPAADNWTNLGAMPVYRQRTDAVVHEGNLYVIGGTDSGGAHQSSIEVYDISADSWSTSSISLNATDRYFPSVTWTPAGGFSDLIFSIGGDTNTQRIRAIAPMDTIVPGSFNAKSVTGLERLAAVTADGVHMIDPDSGVHKRIYTFTTVDESRKAQFGQIGDDLWIATATGAGVGTPEQVLQVKDDAVIPLNLPPLPLVALTQADEGNSALQAGKYAYRYAWVLQDGTIGPASRPYLFTIEDAGAPATLTFQISQFTFPLSDAWSELIRGVAIFLSEEAFSLAESPGGGEKPLERLLNAPYYKVLTLTALDTSTTTEWTDVKEAILTYPQLDDEQLTRHQLKAAALFSYNKRLFLGDTAVDFQRLQGPLNLVGAGAAIGENTAPTVAYQDDGADTLYVEGASDEYTFLVTDPDGDAIDTISISRNDGPGVSSSYTAKLEYSEDGGNTWTVDAPANVDSDMWRVTVTLTVDTITSANEIVLTVEATDALGDTGSDFTGIQIEYTDDQEGGS